MRALSLAFALSWGGGLSMFRDLSFNPFFLAVDVSSFFSLRLYAYKERSQSRASLKKTTPPDQKSSRILLLLLHHHRRSKCTKSRPKSSADGASIGSSWPRLPCLNASTIRFLFFLPLYHEAKVAFVVVLVAPKIARRAVHLR